jgi:DNA-binding MarR family transcriptional regulator
VQRLSICAWASEEIAIMVVDPLKNFPGYSLRRASLTEIGELARRLVRLHLRPTEASVLVVIDANPGITQSAVGRVLEIARPNMTPLTARLIDRDLIGRERVDGRSQGLRLTAAGRQLAKKAQQLMTEHESSLLAKIPIAYHDAFLAALLALWAPESNAKTVKRTKPKAPRRRANSSL